MSRRLSVPLALLSCLACATPVPAQLLDAPAATAEDAEADKGGPPLAHATPSPKKFRVGAIVTAKRGAVRDIFAMIAVPLECDEQRVRVLEEDITPHVGEVAFRDLVGGEARQMVVTIPRLDAGEEARAIVTYEVITRTTHPPEESETAALKAPRRPPNDLRRYTNPSPFIESRHPKIKKLARTILAGLEEGSGGEEPGDWDRVQAFYDHVMDEIEYLEGPDTSALDTLRDESADCHGRSALFIALCRSIGVPARMVWVHNHCYPEFYLEDASGEGRWLPAESAGTRAFGEMPLARTILQKGDNFRVPERPRDKFRYATDFLTGRPAGKGAGKPSVKYLREVVD